MIRFTGRHMKQKELKLKEDVARFMIDEQFNIQSVGIISENQFGVLFTEELLDDNAVKYHYKNIIDLTGQFFIVINNTKSIDLLINELQKLKKILY